VTILITAKSPTPPGTGACLAPQHVGNSPRQLAKPAQLRDEALGAMRYLSPLRYPGAKSGLAKVVASLVTESSKSLGRPQLFVEPFAGGASTALHLAGARIVDRILLADADPLVTMFWQVAAADTEWLIERMWEEPVTLERWDYWRRWTPAHSTDRDIAVKCLFLNRTTFSGILHGRAGPIGGRRQDSPYKIDCRFNKAGLETRLRFIGDLYAANRLVDVWCKDWQATLQDVAEWYPQLLPNRVVAYLDPPYWNKSPRLYSISFDPAGGYAAPMMPQGQNEWLAGVAHYQLAEYLRRRAQVRWVLSYDNHPDLVSDSGLYAAGRMTPGGAESQSLGVRAWHISKRLVNLRYSASYDKEHRGERQELLLTTLPPSRVPVNNRFRPLAPGVKHARSGLR
jgi:site-specific DNA-adenine methylase